MKSEVLSTKYVGFPKEGMICLKKSVGHALSHNHTWKVGRSRNKWILQNFWKGIGYGTQNKEQNKVTVAEVDEKSIVDKAEKTDDRFVDYEKGLGYAGGDMETYLEVLEVYYASAVKYKEELENLYKEQDWEKYTIKIHALKSSSLSIGAVVLSNWAKEMELAGKAGQYNVIMKQHQATMERYELVVADIEKYLYAKGCLVKQESQNMERELKNISMERFMEVVDYIIEACENFDRDEAMERTEELCSGKLYEKVLFPYFDVIKTYIDDYEYEQAVEAVRKAVESIMEEVG